MEHLATAILLVDSGGRLTWMNPAAETLLGVSARQSCGMEIAQMWPEADELNLAIREVAAAGQTMKLRELLIRLRMRAEPLSIDCVISALPAGYEDARMVIEMQPGDADHRLVRDAEHEAQQRLAQRMVVNLAHELRNPLAGLRGAAQLLERELNQASLKEYTQVIMGEADRLGTLVSQLLGPQQPPRARAVNLHRPLEHVRRLIIAEQDHDITIERDYDPSLPPVRVDPDQLVQALLNLLRNASQAVEQTLKARIELRTRIAHNVVMAGKGHRLCARISVIDNGPGIPPDQQERIFFPMVSGHPLRTGLGLAIARGLISANGGRLDCNSRPGRTEFIIDLPLEELP